MSGRVARLYAACHNTFNSYFQSSSSHGLEWFLINLFGGQTGEVEGSNGTARCDTAFGTIRKSFCCLVSFFLKRCSFTFTMISFDRHSSNLQFFLLFLKFFFISISYSGFLHESRWLSNSMEWNVLHFLLGAELFGAMIIIIFPFSNPFDL